MEKRIKNYILQSEISRSLTKTVQIAKVKGKPDREVVLWIYNNENMPEEIQNLKICKDFEANSINLFKSWAEDGKYYACVEHFKFRDLKHFKTYFMQEVLNFELILQNFCRITASLSSLHNNNFSHNNLKSSNILVNSEKLMSLSGFKMLKAEKISSIKPKIQKIKKKSKREIAFLSDIKNLGRIFCEMASVKISKIFTNEFLFHELEKGFKKLDKYDEKLVMLVYKMMTVEDLDEINTIVVMEQVSMILKKVIDTEIKSIKNNKTGVSISSRIKSPVYSESVTENYESSSELKSSSGTVIISIDPRKKLRIPDDDFANPYIKTDYETDRPCIVCQHMLIKPQASCNHCYHYDCFRGFINSSLKNVKSKQTPIKCFRKGCEKLIPFDFILNKFAVTEKNYLLVNKLMYSSLEFICRCKNNSKMFCLNDKFKSQEYKCPECKTTFCTLCSVRGGHRFSCDFLNNYKKRLEREEELKNLLNY